MDLLKSKKKQTKNLDTIFARQKIETSIKKKVIIGKNMQNQFPSNFFLKLLQKLTFNFLQLQ